MSQRDHDVVSVASSR